MTTYQGRERGLNGTAVTTTKTHCPKCGRSTKTGRTSKLFIFNGEKICQYCAREKRVLGYRAA